MSNFLKLDYAPNIAPVVELLSRTPDIWVWDRFLKEHPVPVFREVDTVYLRFPDKDPWLGKKAEADPFECFDQPGFLPEFRPLVYGLMTHLQGERLGRVIINRMGVGARILPHSDTNGELPYYDRFHIVLASNDSVLFRAADERVNMKAGDVWWFDNSKEHEVVNHGNTPRIHLIADIRIRRERGSA